MPNYNNNYYGNNNYTSPYTPYTASYYQQPNYYQPQQQNAFNSPLNASNQMPQSNQQYQTPMQQVYLPLTFVTDYNEAKMFIVKPNQTVYLRDTNNKDIMYIKSVDSQGTTNLQVKKLVDYDMNNAQQNKCEQPISNEPKIDMSEYVKKEEIKSLESKIEELNNIISNMDNKPTYSTQRKASNQ